MTSMTLLIDRRGSKLSLKPNGVVEVKYQNNESHRIGINGLRRIIIHGDTDVSSTLLRTCYQEGIAIVLGSGRGQGEYVHVFPEIPRGLKLRHAQHCCHADPEQRLKLARLLVEAKIKQQATCLEQHGYDPEIIRCYLKSACKAQSINELMGVEGATAARYFMMWGKLWSEVWQFKGRNRRPPRDPVNAMMSLGYTLAINRVGQMAGLRGMDLGMGFLHSPVSGRPSLALDLLEPMRPWVDQWIWLMTENGTITPEVFTNSASEGCRFSKEGRAAFFHEWHLAEDRWLSPSSRHALAIVLNFLRGKLTDWNDTGDEEYQ